MRDEVTTTYYSPDGVVGRSSDK